MSTTRFDAVLFDCDGVLVDSEPIAIAVLREFLRGLGLSIGEDEAYATFLGRGWGTVLDVVATRTGRVVTEAEASAAQDALKEARAEIEDLRAYIERKLGPRS